jgi:mannose-6-phosphate isomerase-like protein (cupin superfamily)
VPKPNATCGNACLNSGWRWLGPSRSESAIASEAAAVHTHTHESIAYVVKGKVKSTVGSEVFIMGPGDVCRHPKGVLHGLEAIEESVVVGIKSPAPDIGAFFATRG